MDDTLDPDRSLLGQLLWSTDPATQSAIVLVWIAAALAAVLVYAPLIVRLVRIVLLDRAVRDACRLDDRPAEAHREEIATAFSRSPLETQWDDFAYRWRGSLSEGDRERSPVRLIDVFEDRPLVPTGARRSLLPALPGLFLAVGVVGTFVGLAAAVGASADAVLVGERVGLALRSSLWGLLFAITAVIGGRMLDGAFDRLAESLDHSVERAFGSVSPGELASLSARAQRDALDQLGTELKRFGSDLTERMDRGLQRIEHSTASAASLVSEEQRSVLQNVVRELSVQVQRGVEQHLAALHEVLDRAVDHQGAVTGGLAEAFDQMAENAQVHSRITHVLEQAALSVQDAATSMSGTAHDLTPLLDRLRDTGSSLSETAATMNETQTVVARSADGIRGSIEHATAALHEQRQFIESGLQEIRSTLELMSTGLGENLERALRGVDSSLERTVGRLRETIDDSNETIDRLSGPVRAAEGMTREMQGALERVRDEIVALGDWLGHAVKPLRGALGQLEDRAGDISRALAQFGERAQHVDKTMDALRGEIHEEGRRFRSSTAELTRHMRLAADVATSLQAGTPAPRLPAAPTRAAPTEPDDLPGGSGPRSAAAAPPTPADPPSAPARLREVVEEPAGAPHPTTPPAPRTVAAKPDAASGAPAAETEAPGPNASGDAPRARLDRTAPASTTPTAPPTPAPPSGDAPATRAPDSPAAAAPAQGTARPLPIRVHASAAAGGAAAASAGMDPADESPRAASSPSRVSSPSLRPSASSRLATPSDLDPSASGRLLGPDPYARDGDSLASFERQRRILESGRSMHRLETDGATPETEEDEDDLTLSGLLTKHRGGASRTTASPGATSSPDTDADADTGSRERPRTWKLLGKD